jgi:hypothetical protein
MEDILSEPQNIHHLVLLFLDDQSPGIRRLPTSFGVECATIQYDLVIEDLLNLGFELKAHGIFVVNCFCHFFSPFGGERAEKIQPFPL